MKKIILFILISIFILAGCSNKDESEEYPVYEGTVVYKTDQNDLYKLFVLQNISEEDLKKGNLEYFVKLAQDQPEASYYLVEKETYESIEVGQKVKITSGFDQLESFPPIRFVKSIEKIN
ncbi:DUF3221 domain-containing protein [Paenibacillus ihbetae]|uniref:DUF3221 domain-containing protein n=1 Tax=Paenibacillus ihbetae TaxID=1870820 RepID=A0A1B2E041_9BACL|nr:DUF3221 domain-containing protein [Paenibacillus ihbetae]ANY73313.1 hypothetical protein BBD41_12385 [Paenibacillus ihbetae]OOC59238.1 hypothetical protein BBD40_26815 [Paenibacillus ihbetae]